MEKNKEHLGNWGGEEYWDQGTGFIIERSVQSDSIKKVKWGQRYEGFKRKYLKKSIPSKRTNPK